MSVLSPRLARFQFNIKKCYPFSTKGGKAKFTEFRFSHSRKFICFFVRLSKGSHVPFGAHSVFVPWLFWTACFLSSLFRMFNFWPSLMFPSSAFLMFNFTFWGWFGRGRGIGRGIRVFWMRWFLPFFLKNFLRNINKTISTEFQCLIFRVKKNVITKYHKTCFIDFKLKTKFK